MTIDFSGPVVTFRSRLFGFDREEVRVCLQNLIADYEDARRQIERLTGNPNAVPDSKELPPGQETAGTQVERVLASAHRLAEEVRVDAENAARQMLREAQEEAAQWRMHAEADATALTRSAAVRVAELESEIQELIDRRHVVQAMLDRAADRLNEIAKDMRQAVRSSTSVEVSSVRMSAII